MCENGPQLCENLCEKNFPKSAKIGKSRKRYGKLNITISVICNNLGRIGSPEVVTENPRGAPQEHSILSLGTIIKSSRGMALGLFMFGVIDI
jgi:hypothetical protein